MFKRFTDNLTLSKIDRIFWQAKFPKRKHCLKCGFRFLLKISDSRFQCRRCGYRFSLKTESYLLRSRLNPGQWYELIYWFVYEFTANKTSKEVKSNQRLIHRCFSIIRQAIHDYEKTEMEKLFSGVLEVDETYVGPKFKNRRKSNRDYYRKVNAVKRGRGSKSLQQPIFGLYQRNGTVYLKFIKDAGKKTLQDIIKGKIVLASEVYTDTWKSYRGLNKQGYWHETIDHGKEEYVRLKRIKGAKQRKKVHINGIEGFWGWFKERLLKHHGVAKGNLIYYVKELEFRFNNRHLSTDELVQKIIYILMNFSPSND
ncbi:IS1595 family transposase [Patescibacteria group bacterium]|nr:IS1595 family transposase [Patescibacteria group bacterium]MBU2264845.1 IS1595 family transposase [Patescibacteria group bacterium]